MCLGSISVVAHVEACMSYDGMVNQKKRILLPGFLITQSVQLQAEIQNAPSLGDRKLFSLLYLSLLTYKMGSITQPFLGSILGITN